MRLPLSFLPRRATSSSNKHLILLFFRKLSVLSVLVCEGCCGPANKLTMVRIPLASIGKARRITSSSQPLTPRDLSIIKVYQQDGRDRDSLFGIIPVPSKPRRSQKYRTLPERTPRQRWSGFHTTSQSGNTEHFWRWSPLLLRPSLHRSRLNYMHTSARPL